MKKSQISMCIAILLILLCLSSCATIISGTTQSIVVNSNVPGATVSLNGQRIGSTPMTATVKRGNSTIMMVEKEGYISQTYVLPTSINLIFLVNIFTGGTTGTTTDLLSGAIYEYKPNTFFVELHPVSMSQSDYNEQYLIRRYAMLNHSQIAIDTNDESGEYLLELSKMMGSKMDTEQAVDSIKTALIMSEGDQLTFGNELIKSFQQ